MQGIFTGMVSAASWAAGKLTGPIFTKELRVSSRQRRNYLMRLVYPLGLLSLLVIVWLAEVRLYLRPGYRSPAWRISRMAEVGKLVIAAVIWFQFCATQLIALVSLSTSISEEVYRRTLGVLLTTPVNAFQIVMGKLLSKLWQLLILVAISLPVLAMVRVFGGVPWDFVVGGLCITVTAMVHMASWSMFFSVFNRRAYVAILMALVTMGLVHGLIPALIFALLEDAVSELSLIIGLSYVSPYFAMVVETVQGLEPTGMRGMWFAWPVHCGVLLAMSAALLAICVMLVRRVGMRQIAGATNAGPNRAPATDPDLPAPDPTGEADATRPPVLMPAGWEASRARVRRIHGPPVLWKELRSTWRRHKWRKIAILAATVIGLGITYLIAIEEHELDDGEAQMAYVLGLTGLAALVTMIVAATPVTSEKESRTWPMLLATTLGPWQILLGKAAGVVRRVMPVWLLLVGHVLLFTLVGYMHPILSLHLAMLVAYTVVFLTATGLYLGARFQRTTTAVVMNIVVAAVVWGILPWVAPMGLFLLRREPPPDAVITVSAELNPVVQFAVVSERTCGKYRAKKRLARMRYDWLSGRRSWQETTVVVWVAMALHFAAAGVLLWRAGVRMRRNIF